MPPKTRKATKGVSRALKSAFRSVQPSQKKKQQPQAIDILDLTANEGTKPPLKPDAFEYFLVLSIVVDDQQELKAPTTQQVTAGTFDWESFRIEYIKKASETPNCCLNKISVRYSLHKSTPYSKEQINNPVDDNSGFQQMETILKALSATGKANWFAKVTVALKTLAAELSDGGGSEDCEGSESEGDDEDTNQSSKKPSATPSATPATKLIKRKRATATSRMEIEAGDRLVEETSRGGWAFKLAQRHTCNYEGKCPRRSTTCINREGRHLAIFPAHLRLWEEAIEKAEATLDEPPRELLEKLVTGERLEADRRPSKKQRTRSVSVEAPISAAVPAIVPTIVPAPVLAVVPPPASNGLSMQELFKLWDMARAHQQDPSPTAPAPAPTPIPTPIPAYMPQPIHPQYSQPPCGFVHHQHPSYPPPSYPNTAATVPQAHELHPRSLTIPITPPKTTRIRVTRAVDMPGEEQDEQEPGGFKSSPIRPDVEQDKLVAFFQYIARMEPHQYEELEELQILLMDEQKFTWKSLTRTLKRPDRGLSFFRAIDVPVGHIATISAYVEGFKKDWNTNIEAAEGLNSMKYR
jgi:hypothetical protein